jgi:hypothetical protein
MPADIRAKVDQLVTVNDAEMVALMASYASYNADQRAKHGKNAIALF